MTTTKIPSPRPASDNHNPLEAFAATFRARRAERLAARKLRDELAAYTTPSDIADLMAMAEREDNVDATRMRNILTARLQQIHTGSSLG